MRISSCLYLPLQMREFLIDSSLNFSVDEIFCGIILGLVIGKPLGILGFTWLSEKLHIAKRPEGLTNAQIFSVGTLAGIGF